MRFYNSSIGRWFLLFSIVPILIIGTIVTFIATSTIKKAKLEDTRVLLQSSAGELVYLYEQLIAADGIQKIQDDYYSGDVKLSGDFEVIDRMKKFSGAEISLFYMDTRILTTIMDENGNRIIHTSATDVWESVVKNGEDYFSRKLNIKGKMYFGYYVPMCLADGTVVGMGFAGIPQAELKNVIRVLNGRCVRLCMILCSICVVLCIIASRHFLYIQKSILSYLNEIDKGIYEHTMDSKFSRRKDEYGVMSRLFVKLNDSLVELILKDGLTNLYNRRAAMQKLDEFVKDANRKDGNNFTFAIGDIDLFKRVNDTYGHNCGDDVLKMVATKLNAVDDGTNFVARWGGEEFVIALKGKLEDNISIIENVADSIRKAKLTYGGKDVSVTMSFGVSEYMAPERLDEVIIRADGLLYQGKEGGRNRIVS